MRLNEYKGYEIFRKNGIKVLKSFTVTKSSQIKPKLNLLKGSNYTLKAQILVGGRGKSGGIKFATKKNIIKVAETLLGKEIKGIKVKKLLITEKLVHSSEIYISIIINRAEKGLTLIIFLEGGVDVEKLSKSSHKKIIKIPMDNFSEKAIKERIKNFKQIDNLIEIIKNLYKIMLKYEAELVEINPLAVTSKDLIAIDAKIIIDENALFRHPKLTKEKTKGLTKIEKQASKFGIQYVELDGDIAVIGNGAGLVMATIDVLDYYGGKPADFLDLGGGASIEQIKKSIDICILKKPKGIFINIFGGITHCDLIAKGIVDYTKDNPINMPIVVRLIGTNEKQGQMILKNNNIAMLPSMEECAKKIIKLVKCQ